MSRRFITRPKHQSVAVSQSSSCLTSFNHTSCVFSHPALFCYFSLSLQSKILQSLYPVQGTRGGIVCVMKGCFQRCYNSENDMCKCCCCFGDIRQNISEREEEIKRLMSKSTNGFIAADLSQYCVIIKWRERASYLPKWWNVFYHTDWGWLARLLWVCVSF